MKIALVSFGHVDVVLDLAKTLSKNINVDLFLVFSLNKKKESIINFENINVNKGFLPQSTVDSILGEDLLDYIGKRFKTNIFIYQNAKIKSIKNFKLSIEFSKTLKDYDLVHLNGQNGANPQLQFLLRKLPRVFTIHDFVGHSGEKKKSTVYLNKLSLYLKNRIIFQNKANYSEMFEKYSRLRNKFYYIPFGPLNVYNAFSLPAFPTNHKTILFFGRISQYKGIEYLIDATKIASNYIESLKVVIAGAGKYHFDITGIKKDKTFEIINRYIPNNELAELIQNCLFVICPYTDATQSGVVMTAYAFNKPVIATNVGGLAEVIKNNVTGKLIPPKDPLSLAEAMIELIKNPDKIAEMSKNIQMFSTQSEFAWVNIAQKTIEVYKAAQTR